MLTVIIGENKSGKSDFAENYVMKQGKDRIYLATMIPYDKEAGSRIERHRRMREGRGFVTIERAMDIKGAPVPAGCSLLLEDMCNLVANELFEERGGGMAAVYEGIDALLGRCCNLTVVSNTFESFGELSEETQAYVKCLYEVNGFLEERSDVLIHMEGGMPGVLKGSI